MSDREENICLIVVLALLVTVLGCWGIYKYLHMGEQNDTADSAAEYSYKVKGSPYTFPDIMLELTFDRELSAEEKQDFCSGVADKMYENFEDDEKHLIHYMDYSDTDTAGSSVELYIDFGCNDGTGLDVLMEYLDGTEAGLVKVEFV